ncbi:MAG TPA: response regulator [Ktedonobacteraceae bacterium]
MAYRSSGKQDYLFPPGAQLAVSHQQDRLRVLIPGKEQGIDHFCDILAENVRRWGYEVIVVNGAMMRDPQWWQGREDDVVLYDLDVLLRHSEALGNTEVEAAAPSGTALVELQRAWPQARLKIVLSSCSVSRQTLERLGAIALLHKPFDMRALERYLRVFQRLLYPEFRLEEAGELTRLARADGDVLVGHPERSGQAEPGVARVLIADDQEEVTWGIRQCLIEQENQRYHYEVKEVHDGLALLEQCIDWQPHCVVTDLLMPWLNGYQVMRCLASAPWGSRPVFIVISALMRHEIPVDLSYWQKQRVQYLNKPFDIEDLSKVIEQELIRSSSQDIGEHGE